MSAAAPSATVNRLVEVAPMVRGMCIGRLGHWDGEDAAQDVLARLWQMQQRPDYTDAPLFGWAATNVRFQVLTVYRQRQTRPVTMATVGELSDRVLPDPGAGPEAHAERLESAREATRQVRGMIERLSPRERQVLLASGLGMRTDTDTATRLGMTPHNVSITKQRALARMREFAGLAPAGALYARRRDRCRAHAAQRRTVRPPLPSGAALPAEVHQAGRAAVRDGWTTADLTREFGVSDTLVGRWRRDTATSKTAHTAHAASVEGQGSTAELVARAHHALAAITAGAPPQPAWMTSDLIDRVAESLATARRTRQRYGRPRLAAEHGLTHHQARIVLEHITNTTSAGPARVRQRGDVDDFASTPRRAGPAPTAAECAGRTEQDSPAPAPVVPVSPGTAEPGRRKRVRRLRSEGAHPAAGQWPGAGW